MRRNIILIATVLYATIGWSQTMNIHYKNGQTVQYNMNNIDYVEYTEDNPNNAQVSSGEAVDLGLSVLWASCNVGATSPEEFGDLYAWGETETKSSFSEYYYLYYNKDTYSYIDIGKDIGGTDYDAAHVKWGGNWRMPTPEEIEELRSKCSWKWSTINKATGYIVTGTNGNSIFLPVKSSYNDTLYWSSQISYYERNKASNTLTSASCIALSKDVKMMTAAIRYMEGYIRPVKSK